MKRYLPDGNERRNKLIEISEILGIIDLDRAMVIKALRNYEFHDFEDCLQAECALKANADYIITRNVKDFAKSSVKAVEPEEFIRLLNNDR